MVTDRLLKLKPGDLQAHAYSNNHQARHDI
jgi:hypothetical protein